MCVKVGFHKSTGGCWENSILGRRPGSSKRLLERSILLGSAWTWKVLENCLNGVWPPEFLKECSFQRLKASRNSRNSRDSKNSRFPQFLIVFGSNSHRFSPKIHKSTIFSTKQAANAKVPLSWQNILPLQDQMHAKPSLFSTKPPRRRLRKA